MMSGNMAEVTLCLFALKLTAFHQLIHFARQGFEMKGAHNRKNEAGTGAGRTQRQTSGTKEKNCAVTFPNILFGS